MSFFETSTITPLPNWAILPVIVRSVTMFARVEFGPSATRLAVMFAAAVPPPFVSLPLALMTAACVA